MNQELAELLGGVGGIWLLVGPIVIGHFARITGLHPTTVNLYASAMIAGLTSAGQSLLDGASLTSTALTFIGSLITLWLAADTRERMTRRGVRPSTSMTKQAARVAEKAGGVVPVPVSQPWQNPPQADYRQLLNEQPEPITPPPTSVFQVPVPTPPSEPLFKETDDVRDEEGDEHVEQPRDDIPPKPPSPTPEELAEIEEWRRATAAKAEESKLADDIAVLLAAAPPAPTNQPGLFGRTD